MNRQCPGPEVMARSGIGGIETPRGVFDFRQLACSGCSKLRVLRLPGFNRPQTVP